MKTSNKIEKQINALELEKSKLDLRCYCNAKCEKCTGDIRKKCDKVQVINRKIYHLKT